jgi:hypothetical protein
MGGLYTGSGKSQAPSGIDAPDAGLLKTELKNRPGNTACPACVLTLDPK